MTHDSKELLARADKYLNTGSAEYASDIMRDMAEYIRRNSAPAPQPGMRAEGEATAAASLLRGWAKAYRDTPEHRFPSDPNAEFFPVDLERAADLLAAPVPPPDGAAITTERLDKLQFGRVLHDRPAPDDVRSALGRAFWISRGGPPENFDNHSSGKFVFDYPPFVACMKDADVALAALRSAPVSAAATDRTAIQEACDLLAERKHGNPARSPGHNARLLLESLLRSPAPDATVSEPDAWLGMFLDGSKKATVELATADYWQYTLHTPVCSLYTSPQHVERDPAVSARDAVIEECAKVIDAFIERCDNRGDAQTQGQIGAALNLAREVRSLTGAKP